MAVQAEPKIRAGWDFTVKSSFGFEFISYRKPALMCLFHPSIEQRVVSCRSESLKAANTANAVWGTFSISGEHFGPKFTLFCRIYSFVVNHSPLTEF